MSAATVDTTFDAVTLAVEPILNAISPLVQTVFDPVTLAIDPVGRAMMPVGIKSFGALVEAVIDSFATLIETIVDALAPLIQAVVNPVSTVLGDGGACEQDQCDSRYSNKWGLHRRLLWRCAPVPGSGRTSASPSSNARNRERLTASRRFF